MLNSPLAAEAPVVANPEEAERAMRQVQNLQAGGALEAWEEVPTIVGDIPSTAHPASVAVDLSPPRKGRRDSPDISPQRKQGHETKPEHSRKQGSADASPPRKRTGTVLHSSPTRVLKKNRHDSPDLSPQGRARHDSPNASPPRRKRSASPDASPPRRKRHDSPVVNLPRRQRHDSPDASPARRKRHDSPDASPDASPASKSGKIQMRNWQQLRYIRCIVTCSASIASHKEILQSCVLCNKYGASVTPSVSCLAAWADDRSV